MSASLRSDRRCYLYAVGVGLVRRCAECAVAAVDEQADGSFLQAEADRVVEVVQTWECDVCGRVFHGGSVL